MANRRKPTTKRLKWVKRDKRHRLHSENGELIAFVMKFINDYVVYIQGEEDEIYVQQWFPTVNSARRAAEKALKVNGYE